MTAVDRPAPSAAHGAPLLLLAVVIGLFLLGDAFSLLIRGIVPGAAMLADPATARVLYPNVMLTIATKAGVSTLFLALAVSRPQLVPAVLTRIGVLLAFFAFAVASIGWSETPANSINDCLYLATAIAAGVTLTIRFDLRTTARVFGYTGGLLALASLATVIALPRYGIHGADEGSMANLAGAWRGVFIGKNTLGQTMAPFVVIFATNGHRLFGSRLAQAAACALTLLLVVQSRSASALMIVALTGATYVLLFRLTGVARTVAVILIPILLLLLGLSSDMILTMLGRGTDLSGRTYIWAAAGRMFLESPLVGYGYGSATLGGLSRYIAGRFDAPHVHNGYIDTALYCGVIGSALFYAAIATALARMMRLWRGDAGQRLVAEVFGTFVIAWLIGAFSEIAFRPNIATGAYGFISLVLLSVPRSATAERAAAPDRVEEG